MCAAIAVAEGVRKDGGHARKFCLGLNQDEPEAALMKAMDERLVLVAWPQEQSAVDLPAAHDLGID